ncbi:MAG TPA: Ig-like domain-containing protein [Gemmatimonadaceae bacterium]|nr:Ig-like domain-containing protein [Gemmatimonadaceae bacterium]
MLISCEPAQPLLVQRPTFSPDSLASFDAIDNGTRSIKLSAPDSSLVTGQSVQATATAYNGQGVANGTAVTWSVSPASVASVSSTGLVTGLAVGSATVSATSGTYTKKMAITVTSGVLAAQISLSANPASVKIGQTTQISALVMYPKGTTMSGSPVVWTSQQPNIGSVSSTGVVTGLAVGTVTILAQADTAKSTISITVSDSASGGVTPPNTTPPPAVPGNGANGGTNGSATPPDLPRASVSTTYPSISRQVRVAANANLQTALNAAQPGDELLLPQGATYTGTFTLPNKGNMNGWIVIRTDVSDAAIGMPGTRMTPSRAGSVRLAKIVANTVGSPLITALGANHYRITGIEITSVPGLNDINALVRFGDASYAQNSVATTANNLILDRSYVHGTPSTHLNRCLMLNSATSAVVDSWLGDCHSNHGESQAIIGWNGPGPFLIQNNHLEAGHEVVAFGGSTMTVANQSPSDITLRGNHITRPVSWKGVWQVKNLLETKHVKRLLVEGNVFENNWIDAQAGFAILVKSENQNNDNPWTTSSDVTFRYNRIRNTGNAFNLAANPSGLPAIPAARILIADNIIENINVGIFAGGGHTLQLLGDVRDVIMRHNTVTSANGGGSFAILLGSLPQVQRLVVHSNILVRGAYGVKGGGQSEGTASLNHFAPGYLFTNNAIIGSSALPYPSSNWFASSLANLGFLNLSGGNFLLGPSSSYLNKGYDGRDIGADVNGVNSQTGAAVVGP